MVVLGLIALVVVVASLFVAIRLAGSQEREEHPPPSEPGDFVAPISSGGFAWRRTDESTEEFRQRVARENAQVQAQPPKE